MRFGDICETKKLKGENGDLKMNIISEIHDQINVSSTIMQLGSHDKLRNFLKLIHPRAPCMNEYLVTLRHDDRIDWRCVTIYLLSPEVCLNSPDLLII